MSLTLKPSAILLLLLALIAVLVFHKPRKDRRDSDSAKQPEPNKPSPIRPSSPLGAQAMPGKTRTNGVQIDVEAQINKANQEVFEAAQEALTNVRTRQATN
jgi:hypothetical protein